MDQDDTQKKQNTNISVSPPSGKEGQPTSVEQVRASSEITLDKEVEGTVQVNNENPILTPEQKKAGLDYSPETRPITEATGEKVQMTVANAQKVVGKKDETSSLYAFCMVFLRAIRKVNFLKSKKVGT